MELDKKYFKISEEFLKPFLMVLFLIVFGFAMFQFGTNLGSNRGRFACNWAKNYQNNFGGPRFGFGQDQPFNDFVDGHGIFGEIIKINKTDIVVTSKEGVEKIINISDKTIIKSFEKDITIENLKLNDRLMIIGDPNDQGQIDAKLIRIFNKPTSMNFKPFNYDKN